MDVIARVVPGVVRMSAEYEGRDIIAVAHGGTIRAALAFALNIGPEAALAFSIENCSVTRLDHITNIPEGLAWRAALVHRLGQPRSEERRVGTECGSTCRSRWSPSPEKKKK